MEQGEGRKQRRGAQLPSREYPSCPMCGKKKAIRNGTRNGQQRFRCRECGRSFLGKIPEVPRYICPYCGGECERNGYAENRRPRFLCGTCGRQNTKLWPETGRDSGGPFVHRMTFSLDGPALEGLDIACQLWQRNMPQAVRYLLIVGTEGAFLDTMDDTLAIVSPVNAVVDDYGNRVRRPYVSRLEKRFLLTVSLNDRALQGLAWTMRVYGLTRQEAMRWLLRRVRRGDFG